MNFKKFLAIILCISVIFISASCITQVETPEPTTTKAEVEIESKGGLPIVQEPLTLKVFQVFLTQISGIATNNNDVGYYKIAEEKTGIHIDWQHPSAAQIAEQFNLMIASKDLPDMIYYTWGTVPGGPQSMLDNDVLLKLNDTIDKHCPNIKKVFENEDIYRQSVLDDGTMIIFPFIISEGHRTNNAGGPLVRGDWLEKLGLGVPKNIDDWENMLMAFKTQDPNGNNKDDEIPFIGNPIGFSYSYGIHGNGFCLDNGKVIFGPATDEYKQYLIKMNDWYERGLLDLEYLTSDTSANAAKVTNELAGAWIGVLSVNMSSYQQAMADVNPNFQIIGTPYLKSSDGISHWPTANYVGNLTGMAITTACKYPVEAAKWCDWVYSDEGHMNKVFGVEGDTYEWENGFPKFTDKIVNNPDGLTFAQAHTLYTIGGGHYQADQRQFEQAINVARGQVDCFKAWQSTENHVTDIFMPPVVLTSDESNKNSLIMTEVNTYVLEMRDKFIMGIEPISKFDEYVKTINSMDIDESIDIMQQAYERYMNR